MKIEILIVDDDIRVAETYKSLTETKTTLSAVATDNPNEALDLIKKHPIRVAVLDQKMPQKLGTELFREIKQINPFVQGIMLSGEAEIQEVADGLLKLGFSDYLHKTNINQISNRILYLYAQYEVEIAKKAADYSIHELYKKRNGILLGNEIKISVAATEIVDDQFIFDNSWFTIKQINAGEQIRETDKIEITKRFIHESEKSGNISTKINSDILADPLIKAGLESVISLRFKDQVFSENKKSQEVSREYKLPEEPSDSSIKYIASRRFQRAPIYRAIRCLLIKSCSCCDAQQPIVSMIYQLTSKVATRQVNYYSDGEEKILSTGIKNC
ncbi:MAG: response regulator [Cyanobacteria bacterium P01_G01_bin.39]